MQNNFSEIWALFNWTSNGKLFGSLREFKANFGSAIESSSGAEATLLERRTGSKAVQKLKKIIKPFVLRRMKSEICGKDDKNSKGGPDLKVRKNEVVVWCKLTKVQRDLCRMFIRSPKVRELLNSSKSPLSALTVMKKICDSPFLLTKEMAMCEQLDTLAEHTKSDTVAQILKTSVKMGVVGRILKIIDQKRFKVVIFALHTKTLDLLQRVVTYKRLKHVRIDGSTSKDQ